MKGKRILVVSPHADDGELGAGGSIARLVEQGARVEWLSFSEGTASTTELLAATGALGIEWPGVSQWDMETRQFGRRRQDILDVLIKMKADYGPTLVFCPSPRDSHQDHQVVVAEVFRAFKGTATILGWEQPWTTPAFNAQCLIRFQESHLQAKLRALACYESQKDRRYMDVSFINGLARVRGVQAGAFYAEAFEVIRWLW